LKLWLLIRETLTLLRKHKMYIIVPILLMLLVLALLAFYVGPGVAVTFVYSGL